MAARYQFDPGTSRFTVQAFASGILSFLGHSPTFAVRDFAGAIRIENAAVKELELTVKANSLELLDKVKAADRDDIESRMRSEVLETAIFPQISFRAGNVSTEPVTRGRYKVRIAGQLSLHGVTNPCSLDAELVVFDDGVRLRGESWLRMSEYRIRPVTALAGAIKLKDELRVWFDLAALAEGT
jgi:polyisoprenoid-binding protein YceI